MTKSSSTATAILLACFTSSALGHLTYPTARDFGIFTGVQPQLVTITGQTAKAFGWADGTDADFAKQDDQRYFQFTLQTTLSVTVSVTSLDAALFLPAFSIYLGRGHAVTMPSLPDYDAAPVTVAYLASLGGVQPRKGAFDALHNFKIGNDSDPDNGYAADLVSFTYMGHAADGTSANYGSAAGILGDNVADGFVSASFLLGPGSYTLVVGGANYASTDTTARGFNATVSTVPEPGTGLMLGLAAGAMALRRRRKAR